jgi:16S rRNA (cytidine1402-2'-O)-methyltransferase
MAKSDIANQDTTSDTQTCYGTLYVVATPIGNLEDLTFRALRILKSVDFVAAENMYHFKRLCRHYGFTTKVTSYNQHNRRHKGPELIKRLKAGSHIALVTNAGTPAISDPGSILTHMALNAGIRVSPIPGPSAVTAALSACGMQMDQFVFIGFLSNKRSKRKKVLITLCNEERTMIFYEAPHRVIAMLNDLKEVLGDRQIVILREITKIYEEVMRGSVSLLLEELQKDDIKGEFTLIVAGKDFNKISYESDEDVRKEIEKALKKGGVSIRDLATRVARDTGVPYRVVYKECLSLKKQANF